MLSSLYFRWSVFGQESPRMTIGSKVNMAFGDGFLYNVIVFYLACFKIDFTNRVAD